MCSNLKMCLNLNFDCLSVRLSVAGGFACNFVACNFPILLILLIHNLDYSVSVTSLKSTSLLLVLQKMKGNPEFHSNAPQWMVDINCVSECLVHGFWSVFFISGGKIRWQTSTPTSARRRTKCYFVAIYWEFHACNLRFSYVVMQPVQMRLQDFRGLSNVFWSVLSWVMTCDVARKHRARSYRNSSEEKGWVGW